jgi:hypothetical protein
MKNCVMLGYPEETTEDKMANSILTLLPSTRAPEERKAGVAYPDVVREALQLFERSLDSFEIREEIHSMRAIFTIDKVLLKERWFRVLVEGRKPRWRRTGVFPRWIYRIFTSVNTPYLVLLRFPSSETMAAVKRGRGVRGEGD